MEDQPPAPTTVRFGPFELLVQAGELRRDGARLKLSGQPIQVLTCLVATPGELVTREQLQARLWPGSSYGDFEKGLNAAVNRLRENLGDSCFALATPVSNYFSQLIVLHYFECGANRADTVLWSSLTSASPRFQQWLRCGPEFILSSNALHF